MKVVSLQQKHDTSEALHREWIFFLNEILPWRRLEIFKDNTFLTGFGTKLLGDWSFLPYYYLSVSRPSQNSTSKLLTNLVDYEEWKRNSKVTHIKYYFGLVHWYIIKLHLRWGHKRRLLLSTESIADFALLSSRLIGTYGQWAWHSYFNWQKCAVSGEYFGVKW